jgi:hypothetical protein
MSVAISAVVLTATMLALAGPAAAIAQSGAGATSPAKTACSLMTPQEIAGITGTRISDGEPQAVSEVQSAGFGHPMATGSTLPWGR